MFWERESDAYSTHRPGILARRTPSKIIRQAEQPNNSCEHNVYRILRAVDVCYRAHNGVDDAAQDLRPTIFSLFQIFASGVYLLIPLRQHTASSSSNSTFRSTTSARLESRSRTILFEVSSALTPNSRHPRNC